MHSLVTMMKKKSPVPAISVDAPSDVKTKLHRKISLIRNKSRIGEETAGFGE